MLADSLSSWFYPPDYRPTFRVAPGGARPERHATQGLEADRRRRRPPPDRHGHPRDAVGGGGRRRGRAATAASPGDRLRRVEAAGETVPVAQLATRAPPAHPVRKGPGTGADGRGRAPRR